jgi:hypothetical protein
MAKASRQAIWSATYELMIMQIDFGGKFMGENRQHHSTVFIEAAGKRQAQRSALNVNEQWT